MNFLVLGINHTTAAVDVRERVAFAPEQVPEALEALCGLSSVENAVILSTCNRTEVYVTSCGDYALSEQVTRIAEWLANYHHLSVDELRTAAYHFQAEHALEHVVRVASGLDSMVLGEPQIFGQLKSAFAVSVNTGVVGAELNRLFQRIFALAKRVRTDTAIGENPVSVAYAAVDLAGHIFTDLGTCHALLVGAGETIELVTRHLIEAGVERITIANRTLDRARELAQKFGADAVLLADIPEQLQHADIVISSTASQLPILGKGAVERALKKRKHRPILMVDIAVPRDIEPEVGDLRDVYLYSVDDLHDIVDKNLRNRHSEARKADLMIAEGVQAYLEELRSMAAVDSVREYRRMAEQLRQQELDRALRALSRGDDPQVVVAHLARGITNKLIHAPTAGLKQASIAGRQDLLLNARRLLGLEQAESDTRRPAKPAATKAAVEAPASAADKERPTSSTSTSRRTLQ
ncbi:glutamyl-tRNA reductase [Parahaliea sp. F7430]|uniref:Glutamyl-tRNA reductase n=1 Tax=Sediminihaliea albiluteola TaxID=2758564 RepID=A0A7W2TW34_9GAMM|nr:glutamyl-tRNA reductase [Sediminihaliea albiluteola]MBA6413020.1 glutamyl-tRNA reductase [Sediminihaliea albiluteola]